MPEHVCGLMGFNPMKGDECPACQPRPPRVADPTPEVTAWVIVRNPAAMRLSYFTGFRGNWHTAWSSRHEDAQRFATKDEALRVLDEGRSFGDGAFLPDARVEEHMWCAPPRVADPTPEVCEWTAAWLERALADRPIVEIGGHVVTYTEGGHIAAWPKGFDDRTEPLAIFGDDHEAAVQWLAAQWWRDCDHGVEETCRIIGAILDGDPGPHHFGGAKLTAVAARLASLRECAEAAEMRAELAERVLAFYADPKSWKFPPFDGIPPADHDLGNRARAVLAARAATPLPTEREPHA